MIHFKSCKWKNFLSTGDEFIEVKLDRSPTTLIVGQNGAGKSTLLDALSFGLFGKPHRDIAKIQLVNSINGKKAIVEVEFDIGNAEFKIVRGIKPNKFEIWQNGNMINQASNARDYQKFLETNILKLNHKSFHQVVVLGSSSFIPFMQLPSWSRRSIIEDLLDINIFSKMNSIIKEKNAIIKDKIREVTYEIDLLKEKIDLQRKYIREVENLSGEQIKDKEDEAVLAQESIVNIQLSNAILSRDVSELSETLQDDLKKANDKKTSLLHYQATFNQQIKTVVKEAKFFEENESCPTCEQEITAVIKETKLSGLKSTAADVQLELGKLAKEVDTTEKEGIQIANNLNTLRQRQGKINSNNEKISLLQKEINKVQKEISNINKLTGDSGNAKKELSDLKAAKSKALENKLEYVEERTYNEVIGEMLKDTGIKTKVIKQYLPVMNRLINQYLQVLDFFVAFHLDENFNETIRSRHRDSFNYASFSEGEKQRIDLSLLFTWRQIAKMKNSAATNLLILDETFDSSLDVDGVDNLTKILSTLEDGTNVFIISHKGDILENKFRSKIEFIKERNFSKIK